MNIIYCCRNKINNKMYIGKTITSLQQRKREHQCLSSHNSPFYLHKAIRKYGWENFVWSVIDNTSISEEELSLNEQIYIDMFSTSIDKYGYNLTHGGEGQKGNDVTREKLRKANIGKKHSPETKKKISDSNKGKIISEYTRRRVRETHLGKKRTEEVKNKISKANTGKKRTEESKNKMRNSALGNTSHLGKKHSKETREKMRVSRLNYIREHPEEVRNSPFLKKKGNIPPNRKKVINLDTSEVFESLSQASQTYKIFTANISRACKDEKKTCGGFHWAYYKDFQV